MKRRTFLAAATGALALPLLGGTAHAAGYPASATLAIAHELLGIPYIYGGNDPKRGLDCSSYVSFAWRIPRQSTDTIHNWSYEIAKADLMPGDALNLPFVGRRSHIRIFAGWANLDGTMAWMYECARGRGSVYRVIGYDSNYTPIRRHNFVPDVPMPEPEMPLDYDVPNGRFFSQNGGADGRTGFVVGNDDGVSFWNEFRRLGGTAVLGLPVTRRFDSHGRVVQVFEKGVLHWNADERRADPGPPPPNIVWAAPAEAREPERSPYLPKR